MSAIIVIDATKSDFPPALSIGRTGLVCSQLTVIGDRRLLEKAMLGLVCSSRCPGDVILQTYDLARELRDAEIPIIGGFHSPMEKECLDLLLRGSQPVVVCPARDIAQMRIPTAWQLPIDEGRLLIVSPFGSRHLVRPTAKIAAERNRFVAALAKEVVIPYAEPMGKTYELCQWCQAQNIPLTLLASNPNAESAENGLDVIQDLIERMKARVL